MIPGKKFNYLKSILALCMMVAMVNNSVGQVVNQERVTMLVTVTVKADQREAYLKALVRDRAGAIAEKGNISMELYEKKDNPNTFYLFERWVNQAALDEHFTKQYTLDVLELNKTVLLAPMELVKLHDYAPLPGDAIKYPGSGDTTVDLVVVFKVKDGAQDAFVRQFQKSIVHSRPEVGNIGFYFHSAIGDSTKFVLYERWRNKAALDFHFAQSYTKELFEMFKTTLDKPVEESMSYIVEIGGRL